MLLTIYARKEPTTNPLTVADFSAGRIRRLPCDVVIYRKPDAADQCGRYPWHYTQSKPTRRNRYIMHNCFRFNLQWLPDLA